MNSLLDIGASLAAQRRAQGLSQRGLGEVVGASQQQVARWESKRYANVDLATVARVAEALGYEPSAASLIREPALRYGTSKTSRSHLEFSPAELREVCRKRAVKRLALFGSVLRDDFGPNSDIDVLVEFTDDFEGHQVYRLPAELEAVFAGRKIDLVEPQYLNSRLRARVLAEAWDVFAA